MFRFTIRDVLWLTVVVAVIVVQQMDQQKLKRERAALAKREAELTSESKMWRAEADRASLRMVERNDAAQRAIQNLHTELQRRGVNTHEILRTPPKAIWKGANGEAETSN